MKAPVEADAGVSAYAGDGMMTTPGINTSEPVQAVYSRTQKRVPAFREALMLQEQQMAQVLEDLRVLEMDVHTLRAHYEEVLQEKLFIENLANKAEKKVQDVTDIIDRYVGVKDAVVASDGFTYERETISSYIDGCKEAGGTPTSYQTEKPLTSLLIPNRSLKTMVDRLVTLQKSEPAIPAPPAERPVSQPQHYQNSHPHHGKPMMGGRGGHASGHQHDGQRRQMHGGPKEGSGAVEVNAKGERVHPCIRVYGHCNYNESCAYAKYPYDACLSNLKSKCRFKNQCHERHVEFRGPLDDYGNPIGQHQGQEKNGAPESAVAAAGVSK
ncbi:RNA binding protein [Novymonas esmeraldas]|uniref:RNA binding protein n=1 Tax=Novymonas esmeraldas TaxID=1808958 RepID=A0AAW0EUM2_9TRYP